MMQDKPMLEVKHTPYIVLMKSGMKECYDTFFNRNETNIEDWQTEYISIRGGGAKRYFN